MLQQFDSADGYPLILHFFQYHYLLFVFQLMHDIAITKNQEFPIHIGRHQRKSVNKKSYSFFSNQPSYKNNFENIVVSFPNRKVFVFISLMPTPALMAHLFLRCEKFAFEFHYLCNISYNMSAVLSYKRDSMNSSYLQTL